MKQVLLLTLICSLHFSTTAQVQFAAAGGNAVSAFSTNGTSSPLHVFNITDPNTCYAVSLGPDGNLYGTAQSGGSKNCGVIFSVHPDGGNFKIVYDYSTPYGFRPVPAFGPDGKLYFVLSDSLFSIALDGSSAAFITMVAHQCSEITIDKDGWLYGYGNETKRLFFKIKIDGTGYTVLHNNNYSTDGTFLIYGRSFCLTPSGRIFLICALGVNNGGTLVSMRTDGSDFTVHKSFATNGSDYMNYGGYPGDPVYKNGKIYFNTGGASNGFGALLSFDTLTADLTVVYAYTANGNAGSIISGNDQNFIGVNNTGLYSIGTNGTNFQQLNTATSAGGKPVYNLATNKIFYIASGGTYKNGYLLKTDATNYTGTNLHNFGFVPDGYSPDGITKASNGLLYGIAQGGGTAGGGTLFKMNTDGSSFAVIKDFNGNDGQSPFGQLLAASDGRLYGICKRSGLNGASDSLALYGINTDGTGYALLQTFSSNEFPVVPELVESSNGLLFGISGSRNGASHDVPIRLFSINKNGSGFTLLKILNYSEGQGTLQGLIAAAGYLYGIAATGGSQGMGTLFRIKEDGSDFSVVKNFSSANSDGVKPISLMQGRDNKLYGVTAGNYFATGPTIYSINPADLSFKVISTFSSDLSSADNIYPYGKLAHASDNRLYVNSWNGIFGMDLDGANHTLASLGLNVNSQQVTYLTEIPMPVAAQLCAPVGTATLESTVSGTVYQWQLNTGNGFSNITDTVDYAGISGVSLSLKNAPSSWNGYQYRCVTNVGTSVVYTLKFTDKWIGAVDAAWENPANWSCGAIPDANTEVIINSGTVVLNSNVIVRSLSIKPGVNFTINNGFTLTVTH